MTLDRDLVNLQSRNVVRSQDPDSPFVNSIETLFPFDAETIERHSLEPLERRPIEYRFTSAQPVVITVRFRYRNLPPYVLRALQLDDLVPRLVIFDLDEVVLPSL